MATLEGILQSDSPTLWLDATAYAERLLSHGSVPWSDTTQVLAWYGKLSGLLKPDVITVPLHAVIEHLHSLRPDLKQAMGARSRALFPVRTLLGDEGLRGVAQQLCTGVCRTAGETPVVLTLPTPGVLTRSAYQRAHDEAGDDLFDPEDFEDAAAYVADFLRELADCDLAGVALVADDLETPVSRETVAAIRPISNVAHHYRWNVGFVLPESSGGATEALKELDFAVAPAPIDGVPTFVWGASGGQGPLRAWSIPADAEPESVLAQLVEKRTP